jgi:L-asparaginase II
MPRPAPLVRVVRSGSVESVHLGDVAVCDEQGRLLAGLGDPHRALFSRSCLKPLQAAVSLTRIAADLPEDLVAIMCASHNGEPEHVRAVRRLLRACGASVSQLGCPPDYPARREDAARVRGPQSVFHNCSGKHAGMVAACVGAGWPVPSYLARSHPLQRAVGRAVLRATGTERTWIGIDGCGAPTFGLELSALATLFARLAAPERLDALAPSAARAVAAMRAHPFLVAGTRRSDTLLMQAVPDVVSKGGAEALTCAALLDRGIGVAVKIADGGDRAAAPALVRVLALLDAVTEAQLDRLAPVARRPVLGGGRPVGELVADFRLRRPRP